MMSPGLTLVPATRGWWQTPLSLSRGLEASHHVSLAKRIRRIEVVALNVGRRHPRWRKVEPGGRNTEVHGGEDFVGVDPLVVSHHRDAARLVFLPGQTAGIGSGGGWSSQDLGHVDTATSTRPRSSTSSQALDGTSSSTSQGRDGPNGCDVGVEATQNFVIGDHRSLSRESETHSRLVNSHPPLPEELSEDTERRRPVLSPVTVSCPGLLSEPVVEVVRDICSRLPPRFVLQTLHIHLNSRLTVDGQNIVEILQILSIKISKTELPCSNLHTELPLLFFVTWSERWICRAVFLQLKLKK